MPLKFIEHISRRTLHTVSAVLVVLTILFFALTRTQVGRDGLSKQIEIQFAKSFRGELKIGELKGDILSSVYASNVLVSSADGEEVVRIDSLVVRPKWASLLRGSFAVHDVTLFDPILNIRFDSSGVSTLDLAFSKEDEANPDSSSGKISFRSASIIIENGSIRARGRSLLPDSASGFDAHNFDIDNFSLSALVDWQENEKQIDVLRMSARLAEPDLNLVNGVAQVVFEDDRITVNQADIQTDSSFYSLRGYVEPFKNNLPLVDLPFQLEILNSTINFNELLPFLPTNPLRGNARITSHIDGPLSEMTVAWLRVEHGESSAEFSGTVRGIPDFVDFDVSLSNSQIISSDLRELLPGEDWVEDLRVDTTSVQIYAQGLLKQLNTSPTFEDTRGTLDLVSDGGLVSGSFRVEGIVSDSLEHDTSIRIQDVDLYKWTNRARFRSSLSGTVHSSGFSRGTGSIFADLTGNFRNVNWDNGRAESIDFELALNPDSIYGEVEVFEGIGSISSTGSVRFADGAELRSETTFSRSNIGPLLGNAQMRSSINASVRTKASLSWTDSFHAEIEAIVSESVLTMGDSTATVPAHDFALLIRPPGAGSAILEIESDMLDVILTGDTSLPTITTLSGAWAKSIRTAIATERAKSLYQPGDSDEELAKLALDEMLAFEGAASRMPSDASVAHTRLEVTIHDSGLLSSLSPAIPALAGGAALSVDLDWSPDSLEVIIDATTPDFSFSGVSVKGYSSHSSIRLNRSVSLQESFELVSTASIDTLESGRFTLFNQLIDTNIRDRRGIISLAGSGSASIDSFLVDIELNNIESTNEIKLAAVDIDTGAGNWALTSPATFTLYSDATVLDAFELEYFTEADPTQQSISAAGVFSTQVTDSLNLSLNGLLLRPLSQFFEMRRTFGGELNTRLILSGGRTNPRMQGSASLRALSIDEKLVGDITFSSDFVSGTPDIAVDLRISPTSNQVSPVLLGTDIPADWIQNDLHINGIVRLPGDDLADRGALDLSVDVDRLDLFFLKYIFQSALGAVSGYATGSGTIQGELLHPVFDVNIGVLDGELEVPLTQAQYSLSGVLEIDEEAIHFRSAYIEDQSGGTAQLTGRLLFNDYTAFTLDMDGTLDGFQIMNVDHSDELPFYGFLRASGDLRLTGPLFDATLTSSNAQTRFDSELFIPIVEEVSETDEAFIVFEDSLGFIPDFKQLAARPFLLARRRTGERQFLDGLNLDLNIFAPPGSTVHLVIDPLLGDVINAIGTGNIQLLLSNGEFQTFGQFDVSSGDYQFTAGELFIRTFDINGGGSILWDGDPINAQLDIPASYRTRASRTGLPGAEGENGGLIPLIVNLQIDGTVESPEIGLSLSIDRSNQNILGDYQALEAQLNQPDRATEYATSVLILNSFQLTTENITTDSGGQLAFNSVSQLVSAQLNRFLNEMVPNMDFSFGLQGESAQDLDVTAQIALRLLNERLIIRGQGVFQGNGAPDNVQTSEGLQGEFVVEVRLSPRVSVEVFFRREGDILTSTELTNTSGVGVSYQTEFESWQSLFKRAIGKNDDES